MTILPQFIDASHLIDLPDQIDRHLQAEFADPFIALLLLGLVDFGPMFRLQAG